MKTVIARNHSRAGVLHPAIVEFLLSMDNSHTKETEQIDLTAIEKSRNFDELISDFYRQMYGCEISPEELAVMQQAAQEAIQEADEAGEAAVEGADAITDEIINGRKSRWNII